MHAPEKSPPDSIAPESACLTVWMMRMAQWILSTRAPAPTPARSDPGMGLPSDAASRKAVPLYSGLVKYFPNALAAVAELSQIGNKQHSPGSPLHWDRTKSQDEYDALLRHLWEAGEIDSDGVRHSVKVAWRALAALEKELERNTTSGGRVLGDGEGGCEVLP